MGIYIPGMLNCHALHGYGIQFRGTTPFWGVSYKRDRLERDDSEKVLGLMRHSLFFFIFQTLFALRTANVTIRSHQRIKYDLLVNSD